MQTMTYRMNDDGSGGLEVGCSYIWEWGMKGVLCKVLMKGCWEVVVYWI